jgi:hypothetical protein
MKQVPIGEVKVGAVLAADLKNGGGSMILGQGATLTASVLVRLQKMGIVSIPVEMDDPAELAREVSELVYSIQRRFRGTEEDEFLQELMRIAIQHVEMV